MSEAALWIGANDMSTEGGWQWSSGDPFRYLNWNAGAVGFCVCVYKTSDGPINGSLLLLRDVNTTYINKYTRNSYTSD